jgi:hypothetical protein
MKPYKTDTDFSKVSACPNHPYGGTRCDGFGRVTCDRCGFFLHWTEPPDPLILRKPACSHCDKRMPVKLGRMIAAGGQKNIAWYCTSCLRWATKSSLWLPHPRVERTLQYIALRYPDNDYPLTLDEIPLINDYSHDTACFICGAPGAQYNHFLPQVYKDHPGVSGEWERWNECGAYLCQAHHDLWHNLVAPLGALATVRNGVR